jgi:hypothetical protein
MSRGGDSVGPSLSLSTIRVSLNDLTVEGGPVADISFRLWIGQPQGDS